MQHKLSLNQNTLQVWQRIQAHSFEIKGDSLSFAARLARENRWSDSYTMEVIEEYRRFCLLAVIAGHPLTPSEDVDQVWHLHLTYTQDYWEVFCPKVLKAEFHHGPTRGGKLEHQKFWEWYQNTLDSYSQIFGTPPANIWPEVSQRFSNIGERVFVNRANDLIISKRLLKNILSIIGISGAALLAGNVFADTGNDDGYSLIWLMVIGVVIVFVLMIMAVKQKSKANNEGKNGSESGVGGTGSSDSACDGSSGCGGGCGGCGG